MRVTAPTTTLRVHEPSSMRELWMILKENLRIRLFRSNTQPRTISLLLNLNSPRRTFKGSTKKSSKKVLKLNYRTMPACSTKSSLIRVWVSSKPQREMNVSNMYFLIYIIASRDSTHFNFIVLRYRFHVATTLWTTNHSRGEDYFCWGSQAIHHQWDSFVAHIGDKLCRHHGHRTEIVYCSIIFVWYLIACHSSRNI